MKFYYNGKLMRTSQTKNYKFALINENGGCEMCSESRSGLESKRMKFVKENKEYYYYWKERKEYYHINGEVREGNLAECDKGMERCLENFRWFNDSSKCIVVLEAR